MAGKRLSLHQPPLLKKRRKKGKTTYFILLSELIIEEKVFGRREREGNLEELPALKECKGGWGHVTEEPWASIQPQG